MIKIPSYSLFFPSEKKEIKVWEEIPLNYSLTTKFFHPQCKIYQCKVNSYIYYCYKCNVYIDGLPELQYVHTFNGRESMKGKHGYESLCKICSTEISFFGIKFF